MEPFSPNQPPFKSVRIVGSGLIGTSIGLALVAQGIEVDMRDIDNRAELLARDLVKSQEIADPEITILAYRAAPLPALLRVSFLATQHRNL